MVLKIDTYFKLGQITELKVNENIKFRKNSYTTE